VSQPSLIALDWGTSNLRASLLDAAGAALDTRSAAAGVMAVPERRFAEALLSLCGDWLAAHPHCACIASGMVGSRQGWVEAPYLACPADLGALAAALRWTPERTLAIVPGVICRDAADVPDVMRGEETQILGAREAWPGRALAVLPGTHSKWVHVDDGRIAGFTTYMTGELYAVLLGHTILGRMAGAGADPDVAPGAAFARGVERGLGRGDLAHDIFGARTLSLTGELAAADVGDRLSGLLIGREIRAARAWATGVECDASRAWVIGNDALTARYGMAFAQAGITAEPAPAGAAARGLWAIARSAALIDATKG
jgi:2-dehydro-3-deoxygalactonokinase